MAVTTTSGNGLALYNGIKLPNINTVWTVDLKPMYPFAYISVFNSETIYFRIFRAKTVGQLNGTEEVQYAGSQYWTWVFDANTNSWGSNPSSTNMGGSYTKYIVWANYDVINSDGSVYLAASDPISLDGMTVIEWDGDTTGLESIPLNSVQTFYRVADYIDLPPEVYVQCAAFSIETGAFDGLSGTATDVSGEEGVYWGTNPPYAVCYNEGLDIAAGLYFMKANEIDGAVNDVYTNLLAYPASGESEPTYDRTAFLSGLAMGLCGKGDPTFEGSGKYLYNGMKFPKLPERDKSIYPHAVITYGNLLPQFENNVSLYFLKEIRYSELGGLYVYNGLKTPSTAYSDDFVWGALQESISGSAVAPQWLHWANTDILDVDGSVYLAASDPVPVEDTFTKGYHVGAELRRKRVLPVHE